MALPTVLRRSDADVRSTTAARKIKDMPIVNLTMPVAMSGYMVAMLYKAMRETGCSATCWGSCPVPKSWLSTGGEVFSAALSVDSSFIGHIVS